MNWMIRINPTLNSIEPPLIFLYRAHPFQQNNAQLLLWSNIFAYKFFFVRFLFGFWSGTCCVLYTYWLMFELFGVCGQWLEMVIKSVKRDDDGADDDNTNWCVKIWGWKFKKKQMEYINTEMWQWYITQREERKRVHVKNWKPQTHTRQIHRIDCGSDRINAIIIII